MTKRRKHRRSRSKYPNSLPKGAYRLPTGGYVAKSRGVMLPNGRRLRIVAVHRDPVNVDLLAKALLDLAREQAEAKKQRESR